MKDVVILKLKVIIDKNAEEEIIIHARRNSELITAVSDLVNEHNFNLLGQTGASYKPIEPSEVFFFTVEENKVYAFTEKEKMLIKYRLYQLEEKLPVNFVKINQSCIANIKQISRFDTSVSGAMKIVFKNGYTDYVSRRQLKTVKERVGI